MFKITQEDLLDLIKEVENSVEKKVVKTLVEDFEIYVNKESDGYTIIFRLNKKVKADIFYISIGKTICYTNTISDFKTNISVGGLILFEDGYLKINVVKLREILFPKMDAASF